MSQSDTPTPRPLRNPAIRTWRRLAHLYTATLRDVARELEPHGLTVTEFDLLATLHARPDATQRDVADDLVVTAPNVTYHVQRLAERELLERRTEGRTKRLRLTPAGRDRYERALPAIVALHERQFATLDTSELAALGSLLGRLKRARDTDD